MKRTVLLLASLWSAAAPAYELRRDASGVEVSWEGPVRFVVHPQLEATLNVPSAVQAVLEAVATYRAEVPGLALEARVDASGEASANEVVALTEWPFEPDHVAVTRLTLDPFTHRIVEADILLNAQHRRFQILAQAQLGGEFDDLQNTVTHELGHALGLAHSTDDTAAVMYPAAARGEIHKRQLADDDRAGLAAAYPQAVGPATGCTAAPGAATWLAAFAGLSLLLRARRRG